MKVVELKRPNLMDVPSSLRRLADQIQSGETSCVHAIVVAVDSDGIINSYGFGEIGNVAEEVGTLHMAALQLGIK